jgi:2OG-Fe(II) oxygenase superfamily
MVVLHCFCHHPSRVLLVSNRYFAYAAVATAAARVITTIVQPPRPPLRQRYYYFSTTSTSSSSNHNDTESSSSDGTMMMTGSSTKTTTTTFAGRRTALTVPIFDADRFLSRLRRAVPAMAASLRDEGYWTNLKSEDDDDDAINKITEESGNDDEPLPSSSSLLFLTSDEIQVMRRQAIRLRQMGRFEQSWSERIDALTGAMVRFDKPGVYACEPDGGDYDTAPDLLSYLSTVVHHLPPLVNEALRGREKDDTTTTITTTPLLDYYPAQISNRAFNAKLAVTLPGGSVYPLHVDNPESSGLLPNHHQYDTRKLTCILYLNPVYAGGALRLFLLNRRCVELSPRAGRLVLFWSDEIPHEVLPCAPDHHHPKAAADGGDDGNNDGDDDNDDDFSSSSAFDRYALTIWWPDDDPHRNVHRHGSKFEPLRVGAFTKEKWC